MEAMNSRTGQVVTLTFHGVGEPKRQLDPGEETVWLTNDHFLQILDALPRDDRVQITFDDGNASDLEFALPALLDRGLRATFFVLVGRIGDAAAVSATDLDELLRNGMEVGSHGMWHRSWRRMTETVALEEIFEAKSRLEEIIKRPVTKAACPFGTYDRFSLRLLKNAGFRGVYTSDGGLAHSRQWLQARNTIRKANPPDVVAKLRSETTFGATALKRGVKRLIKRLR